MGSNQEFARIQEWVANWYGTSVDGSPYSREDIRNICRGPMREVLVDFLVTRFRTNAQIKVIRSNLFLTDMVHSSLDDEVNSSGDVVNQDCDQIKQLKLKLEEIQNEKMDIVTQILKTVVKMRESKVQLEKELLEYLSHFEKLESRMQLITHRVVSTTALLEDVCNIKPPNTAIADTVVSSNSNEVARTESVSPQLIQLKALYSKASDLFNLYFLQNSTFSDNASSSSADIQAVTSAVASQTMELTQSGVKPNFVEKWARKEQEFSSHQINKVEIKFSNVMSPVEELANEAEALHSKLMKAHVNVHFENIKLRQLLREVKPQRSKIIQNLVLRDTSIVPADFLSFIRREEQQKKLLKCRELAKQLKCLNYNDTCGRGNDMLAIICGEGYKKSANKMAAVTRRPQDECRGSFGGGDDAFNIIKQEILEDLTCALLKSFPDGKNKLESTVSQCKNLVLEKFATMFADGNSFNNDTKLGGVQTDRGGHINEALDFHVKVPLSVHTQDFISTNCSIPVANEESQMDLLKDVLKMQNELNESRLQFEAINKKPSTTEA